jgi:hypothetical protein
VKEILQKSLAEFLELAEGEDDDMLPQEIE